MSSFDISKYRALAIKLNDNDALRNQVYRFVLKNSGTESDAITVFTDAIIAYVKSNVTDKTDIDVLNKAYFFGIAKNCWYKELRNKKLGNHPPLEWKEAMKVPVEEIEITDSRKGILQKFVSLLDEKCRKVLTAWSYNHSMREIAQSLDYKSEMMARKKKYQCLQKLRKIVEDHPGLKNDLLN